LKPTSLNLETPSAAAAEQSAELPVWMQRLFVIVYVVFCIEMGVVLLVLGLSSWVTVGSWWFNNSLLAHWPTLRHVWQHAFVRGAVCGLGLIDLWIGISEAVRYRDRR
jgi:hypothetical protein